MGIALSFMHKSTLLVGRGRLYRSLPEASTHLEDVAGRDSPLTLSLEPKAGSFAGTLWSGEKGAALL